tara:strand:- start:3 stop:152 length:150 start_codon:yes stop_codon:yes gene_type:complete
MHELKTYAINATTLGITSLSGIEDWLKVILLLVTIGYTITRWAKTKDEE